MVWPADYHMHTPLCHHAVGEPTDYAAAALRLGFTEIGMSDHSPMPRDDFDDWRMRADDLDVYVEKVMQARAEYPQLSIKLGLEVDYIPGQEPWIRQLASRHPWDYFIGSVHYVAGSWDLDNPKKLSEWSKREPFEVWQLYFERLAQAASSGLFDTIGHADLPKKFCFYPQQDCRELYATFVRAAAAAGVAMELNTAGLRKECREIYPSAALVAMASELKVPITFGSDAHAPGEVGMNFREAIQLARSAGYTEFCTFTRRHRSMKPIGDA